MAKAKEHRDAGTHLVKASDTAAGVKEVYVAGELEFCKRAERLRDGIPVSEVVWSELEALAAEQQLPFGLG